MRTSVVPPGLIRPFADYLGLTPWAKLFLRSAAVFGRILGLRNRGLSLRRNRWLLGHRHRGISLHHDRLPAARPEGASFQTTNEIRVFGCLPLPRAPERRRLSAVFRDPVGRFLPAALFSFLVLLAAAATPRLTLRQAGDRAGILVGTAVRPTLFAEGAYSGTLGREFSMVEPEDAMKWWVVRRNEVRFDFQQGDEIVAFARAHGMKVRGHCLVWDHTNPQWLVDGQFQPEQMAQMLQQHIRTVMQHYAGRVFAWDVVNEALDENGRFKDSPWYNQPGIGLAGKGSAYVEQAFRWAHEADPKALLFYNENGAEGLSRKSDAGYAMVKDFKSRGVPIDGVGLQMHISGLDFDTSQIAGNMARITKLGLQVHITELDVSLPADSAGSFSKGDLQRQGEVYRGVTRACVENPGCTAIQTWGFTDKYSWIGSHSHGMRGGALPFDRLYRPKPAYDAMIEEIRKRPAGAKALPLILQQRGPKGPLFHVLLVAARLKRVGENVCRPSGGLVRDSRLFPGLTPWGNIFRTFGAANILASSHSLFQSEFSRTLLKPPPLKALSPVGESFWISVHL